MTQVLDLKQFFIVFKGIKDRIDTKEEWLDEFRGIDTKEEWLDEFKQNSSKHAMTIM